MIDLQKAILSDMHDKFIAATGNDEIAVTYSTADGSTLSFQLWVPNSLTLASQQAASGEASGN
jgi:hypothetical protein